MALTDGRTDVKLLSGKKTFLIPPPLRQWAVALPHHFRLFRGHEVKKDTDQ
jgi:hypothetical protein